MNISKKQNSSKINELIKSIPKGELKILKNAWNYFLQNKEWPKGKSFRKEQGRKLVVKTITNLSPIFIHHIKYNPGEDYYKLTTEGIYAIEGQNGQNIRLLLSFLDYLRKKFDKDPDFERISAKELREHLNINSRDTRIIGEFLEMGNYRLWSRSGSNIKSPDWKVGVIDEIELLYEAKNSLEFLLKQWNDNIERIITYYPDKVPDILGIKKSKIPSRTLFMEEHRGFDKDYLVSLFEYSDLHEKIKSCSKSLFITNHFSQAIFEALKALEAAVKEVSKLDLTGQDLMAKAFGGDNPIIRLNHIQNISDKDEQAGFRFIYMGLMRGIRNPIAHKIINWSNPSLALQYLSMMSLLFEKLDNRIFPKK